MLEGERRGKGRVEVRSGLPYPKDLGPAVRTDARDGRLPVLERYGLGVLYLHVRLALDTVRLWHT